MDCKTALALLEPYLDNELDRADARELEAHVDTCADCAAALTRLGDLRQSLRDQTLRHTAPPELRERIRAVAAGAIPSGAAPPPRSASRWTMPPWSRLAAACVLAFGAGGVSVHLWNSGQSPAAVQTQVARDLFASHWRALAAATPVDVVSSDRHTVKPWFAGKLDFSPDVRDLAAQGFPLVGGRVEYLAGRRVAALVYQRRQHVINVFIWPATSSFAGQMDISKDGYNLLQWTHDGMTFWAISDVSAAELETLRTLFT